MRGSNVKLNLTIDFGVDKKQYDTPAKQREFNKGVFRNAVDSAFPNGLSREQLCRFRDISEKIDEAEGVEISLNPYEFDFFKEAFEKAKWKPVSYSLICQFYKIIEDAGKPKSNR